MNLRPRKDHQSGRRRSIDDILEGKVLDAQRMPDPLYWDFSSCPAGEVDECRAYEFARHVRAIREDVARLRKGMEQSFDKLFAHLRKTIFASGSHRQTALFWFYPEFPKQPYLSVPAEERNRRTKLAWPLPERAAMAAALHPKILPLYLGQDLRSNFRKSGERRFVTAIWN